MALELPFGVKPVNPVAVDAWSGPYSGANESQAINAANSGILPAVRFQSMEVRLLYNGSAHKYWYRDGLSDSDLVPFNQDYSTTGSLTSASGYLQQQIDSNDTDISNLSGLVSDNESDISIISGLVNTSSGDLQSQINGLDNYQQWNLQVEDQSSVAIQSNDTVIFTGEGNITIDRSGQTISISGEDTDLSSYATISYVDSLSGYVDNQDTSLQNQITSLSGDVVDNTSDISNMSGDLQSQINSLDNYQGWNLQAEDGSDTQISSLDTVIFSGQGNNTVSRLGNTIVISGVDTDLSAYATTAYVNNVSGNLQSDIDNNASDIVIVSGIAQDAYDATGILANLVDANTFNINVLSGLIDDNSADITSLSGYVDSRDSLISGNLQSQIDSIDTYEYWSISDNANSGNISGSQLLTVVGSGLTDVTFIPAENKLVINSTGDGTGLSSYSWSMRADDNPSVAIVDSDVVTFTGAGNVSVSRDNRTIIVSGDGADASLSGYVDSVSGNLQSDIDGVSTDLGNLSGTLTGDYIPFSGSSRDVYLGGELAFVPSAYRTSLFSDGVGIAIKAPNTKGMTINGWGQRVIFHGLNFGVILDDTPLTWNQDVYLVRDGANELALRNGINNQSFRIYNEYSSVSNYSRLAIYSQAGNYYLEPQSDGGGASGSLYVTNTSSLVPQFIVAASSGQVEHVQEWQSHDGDILAFVDYDGSATFGDITATGNLNISGTLTYINSTNVTISDKQIELASNTGSAISGDAFVDQGGILLRSTDSNKEWIWKDSTDAWYSSENIELASSKHILFGDGTQQTTAYTGQDNYGSWSISVTGNSDQISSNEILYVSGYGLVDLSYDESSNTLSISGLTDYTGYASQANLDSVSGNLQSDIDSINEYQYWTISVTGNTDNILDTDVLSVDGAGSVDVSYDSSSNTLTISGSGDFATNSYVDTVSGNLQSQITQNNTDINIVSGLIVDYVGGEGIAIVGSTIQTSGTGNFDGGVTFPDGNTQTVAYTGVADSVLAGGQTGSVQFNEDGVISGNSYLVWDQAAQELTISGKLNATTKSFLVEHPTKPGYMLQHACLEGPENSVYVRGKVTGTVIELPEYWSGLVDEETITVSLTPYKYAQPYLYVESVSNTGVTLASNKPIFANYIIYGERKDVDKLRVEWEK